MAYWPIAKTVRYGAQRLPISIVTTLKRLVAALELYRRRRRLILIVLFLSVLIHSCLVLNLSLIGTSVGEDVLTLRNYFLAVPVANAVAGIPVTPGGIGTRDAIIAMFFSAMQGPMEKNGIVPVIGTLVFLFWGFVGGIIFIISRISRCVERETAFVDRSSSKFYDGSSQKSLDGSSGRYANVF
jgi:uncharacterized protein (TIRG00374 family)